MTKCFFIILLVANFFTSGHAQSLSGKIFELGSENKNCKIVGNCDCCTSDLYFINLNQFILADNCESQTIFTTGTYKIKSKTVTLYFKDRSVTSGVDYDTNQEDKSFIGVNDSKIAPASFSISSCGVKDIMLINSKIKNYNFGLRGEITDESTRIKQVMISEEWKLLSK
jgi:hypothetical protein